MWTIAKRAGKFLTRTRVREKLHYRSLFIFEKDNRFRRILHIVCTSWLFEYFILVCIVTSCVIVVLQDQVEREHLHDPYVIVDLTLNVVFGLEALVKIIAFGFIMHKGAYLRKSWNIFDFIVVITGFLSDLMSLLSSSNKSVSLKALRIFRVVRPLRIIAKLDNLKVVLDTLLKSFGTLVHVLMFLFLLVILYATTGMELFGGLLHTVCHDENSGSIITPVVYCKDNYAACNAFPNATCRHKAHEFGEDFTSFDNIFYAIIAVIQVITMEDWVFLMYKLNKVASPVTTSIYFISLILIGGYFAVDLLMGVLGNQYMRTKQCLKKAKQIRKEKLAMEKRLNKDKSSTPCERAHTRTEQVNKSTGDISNIARGETNTGSNTVVKATSSPISLKQTSSSFLSLSKDASTRSPISIFFSSIVETKWFFTFVMALIISDVIFSTIYGHIMDIRRPLTSYLVLRSLLIFLYIVELIIVFISERHNNVMRNGLFLFNTAIVGMSVIEIMVLPVTSRFYVGLSVIRGVALIQVFKYSRFWLQMATIIKSFVESIKGVTGIMGLLSIVLLNYALLGNQLFRKNDPGADPIGTFDTFGSSLMLSFVLLTGNNWTTYMEENINRASSLLMRILTIIYFLSFVLFANFILMNVFLGIIVDNLTSDYEENTGNEMTTSRDIKIKSVGVLGVLHTKVKNDKNSDSKRSSKVSDSRQNIACTDSRELNESGKLTASVRECIDVTVKEKSSTQDNKQPVETTVCTKGSKEIQTTTNLTENSAKGTKVKFAPDSNIKPFDTPAPSFARRRFTISVDTAHLPARMRAFSTLLDPDILHPIPKHKSLFFFGPKHPIRLAVFRFVTSSNFTLLVAVAILLSSLMMAFGDPLERDKERQDMMAYIDYFFIAIFFGEFVLKTLAYGFVFGHKKCYLREPMNVLDFSVLIISIFNIFMNQFGNTRQIPLRVLRVIRIVRMLKVSPKLKRVINCLINSVQRIIYFLVLYMLILFLYAIIGVQLYGKTISLCDDVHFSTKGECQANNHTWDENQLHFANVGKGMTTLFVLSTMDDWFAFLDRLLHINHVSGVVATIYILSFILIMSFIMINVFVGFVIVIFHTEKEKNAKCKVLDKTAQECIIAALKEKPTKKYVLPPFEFQRKVWKVVTSKSFQAGSILLIILNTLFLTSKTQNQNKDLKSLQHYANITFTVIFTVEILLKAIAFPCDVFLHDMWLVFDTIVVAGSWVDVILSWLNVSSINVSLFRLFRVARLAKVVGKGGNLRQLFSTFLKSMKSVPHIALLLALLLYLYAIIGMELFGKIRLDETTAINENTNFQTFAQTVLVLIRITTLDGWHEIMLACADVDSMNCQDTNENCGSYFSYFFFASFVFLCSYIMTHLFLAVIMDNFVYLTHDISTLDNRHIHKFTALWRKFDREGKGHISTDDMLQLLRILDPPLGAGVLSPQRYVYGKVLRLKIPIEDNKRVKFKEMLMSLVMDSLNIRVPTNILRDDIQNLVENVDDNLLDRILPLRYDPRVFNRTEIRFYQCCAAVVISGYYKIFKSEMRNKKKQLGEPHNENNIDSHVSSSLRTNFIP